MGVNRMQRPPPPNVVSGVADAGRQNHFAGLHPALSGALDSAFGQAPPKQLLGRDLRESRVQVSPRISSLSQPIGRSFATGNV